MDFWIKVERGVRRIFMGEDWRIHAENPAGLLDFTPKGMSVGDIQARVDQDFDCGSFPVKVKVQGASGDIFQLSRSGMLEENQVCTGQISGRKGRYLTFDLTQ